MLTEDIVSENNDLFERAKLGSNRLSMRKVWLVRIYLNHLYAMLSQNPGTIILTNCTQKDTLRIRHLLANPG